MNIIDSIKVRIKIFLGKTTKIKKNCVINCKWYGSLYGGFYVHPDLLTQDSIIYSFGIGEDISFDKDIIEEHQCKVFAFDPTPKSISWVGSQLLPDSFSFFEYGISNQTESKDFYLPLKSEQISGSVVHHKNVDDNQIIKVQMKQLIDIATKLKHSHINVLKMDIEGSEYETIDNILEAGIPIDQILLELHERFFGNEGRKKTKKLLKTLKDNGYEIFGVSDSMQEISFIKSKLVRKTSLK
jgi:FkbM family methyltransferase